MDPIQGLKYIILVLDSICSFTMYQNQAGFQCPTQRLVKRVSIVRIVHCLILLPCRMVGCNYTGSTNEDSRKNSLAIFEIIFMEPYMCVWNLCTVQVFSFITMNQNKFYCWVLGISTYISILLIHRVPMYCLREIN